MKLYYGKGACSLAVNITLREAGFHFELEPVDLTTPRSNQYLQVNPKGYVPTLQLDDGQLLTEVAVILQYIADQVPDQQLIPAFGKLERYQYMSWLNFISAEIHKGFGPLWNPQTPEAYKEIAISTLNKRFDYLSQHFQGNDYVWGKKYTVADAYLFTILNWTHFLNVDISKRPALMGFMERVGSRPATKEALKAEGLV